MLAARSVKIPPTTPIVIFYLWKSHGEECYNAPPTIAPTLVVWWAVVSAAGDEGVLEGPVDATDAPANELDEGTLTVDIGRGVASGLSDKSSRTRAYKRASMLIVLTTNSL